MKNSSKQAKKDQLMLEAITPWLDTALPSADALEELSHRARLIELMDAAVIVAHHHEADAFCFEVITTTHQCQHLKLNLLIQGHDGEMEVLDAEAVDWDGDDVPNLNDYSPIQKNLDRLKCPMQAMKDLQQWAKKAQQLDKDNILPRFLDAIEGRNFTTSQSHDFHDLAFGPALVAHKRALRALDSPPADATTKLRHRQCP
jgi:hypothetical protein